jgi:uncharacterized membrane protein
VKSSLSLIKKKNLVASLINRLDQVEDRILGLRDKTDKLQHSDKDKEKIRKHKETM